MSGMGFRQYRPEINAVISEVYKILARDLLIGEIENTLSNPPIFGARHDSSTRTLGMR